MNQHGFDTKAHRVEWIPVKNISVVWSGAQRPYDERHAKTIADNLDPDMFGVLAVTLPNGNGIYHAIDGQHRRGAVQMLWGDNEKVPCMVFDTIDPKRAAEIFNSINTARKSPHPVDLFKVRVTAEKETEVTVNKIVKSAGYRIEASKREGSIAAVQALLSVYKSSGPGTLSSTLRVIQNTWGMDANAVVAPIIRGYGAFIAEYGKDTNFKRLEECVSKKMTPGRIIGAARIAQEMTRGNMTGAFKQVLLNTYNHGLKSGKLGKAA